MNRIHQRYLGYLLLIAAQSTIGLSIVGSKSLLADLSPYTILIYRFAIAFFVLLGLHFVFSKKKLDVLWALTLRDWLFIFGQALSAGALFNLFLLMGLQHTTASLAGIVSSALPAIVMIFSMLFLKERLTWFSGLCIFFAVTGLLIINAHSFHLGHAGQLLGGVLILIALMSDALYYILCKLHHNRLPIFLVSAIVNGINIPIFFLIAFLHHDTLLVIPSFMQAMLLLIVGLCSAFFYVFWFLGCKHVSGTAAGLSTAFLPMATLGMAAVFLGESISWVQFVGMVLVIVSIVFHVGASGSR